MKKRNRFLLWGAALAVLILMAASAAQAIYYDGYVTNLLVKGNASITNLTTSGTTTIGSGATLTSPTINTATMYTPTVSAATITGSSFAGTAALTTGTVSTSLSGSGTATSSGFLWSAADKSTDYTLTAADNGKLLYFTASATLTLCDAAAGYNTAVATASGVTVTINPYSTNSIAGLTNGAGDAIQNTGGGLVQLVSPVADTWFPLGTAYGTWSDVN